MTITNLERVLQQLRQYGEGFEDGAFDAQVQVAKEVMLLARDVYCPIETGALRGTALITAELREMHLSSVDVQFGGPAAPYAALVHEDLSKFHAPPTSAKFLERAAHEKSPEMTVRVGQGAVAAAKARAGI